MSFFARLFSPRPRTTPAPSGRTYRPRFDALEQRDCPALVAPANLTLVPRGSTQVDLAWVDRTTEETGYRVVQWDGIEVSTVVELEAGRTDHEAKGRAPGTRQWFAVEAFDADGNTARSDWKSCDTPRDPITAPTGLKLVAGGPNKVTVSWNDATGETSYKVFRWDAPRWVLAGTVAAGKTSLAVSGLDASATHFFYVEAVNASNAARTDFASVRTPADPITGPTNLLLTPVAGNRIDLTWKSGTGETGTRVYLWDGARTQVLATLGANASAFSARGLTPGKVYWFYLQAFNPTNAANTAWKYAVTPSATRLQPPAAVNAAKAGATSINLAWSKSAGAAGYNIFVWTGATWRNVKALDAATTRLTINGLARNTTYYFIVQAFTQFGLESANSRAVYVNL